MVLGFNKRTVEDDAVILFLDEASVRADYHRGTTWSKQGVTPVVSDTGDRFSLNLVLAISADERMMFNIIKKK